VGRFGSGVVTKNLTDVRSLKKIRPEGLHVLRRDGPTSKDPEADVRTTIANGK
jgi:hypothetical protein